MESHHTGYLLQLTERTCHFPPIRQYSYIPLVKIHNKKGDNPITGLSPLSFNLCFKDLFSTQSVTLESSYSAVFISALQIISH